MYELLLRTETYFLGFAPMILLGGGLVAALIGLCLWLIGARYSTAILGLLGAVVGTLLGMLAGKWLGVELWMAMAVGALALGAVSIVLRNVLIVVLATLIFAGVCGTGYLAVNLNSQTPPPSSESAEGASVESVPSFIRPVPFKSMSEMGRLEHFERISQVEGSSSKLSALLQDTWAALGPDKGKFLLSAMAGGLGGLLLIWFIRKIIMMLAYSIVGSGTTLLGVQSLLLGVGFKAVSALDSRQWALPATFVAMVILGWLSQLVGSRSSRTKKVQGDEAPEATPAPKRGKWHTTFNRD